MDPVWEVFVLQAAQKKKGENLLETQDMFIPGAETLLPWQDILLARGKKSLQVSKIVNGFGSTNHITSI